MGTENSFSRSSCVDVAVDRFNDIYTLGRFTGNVDCDPGLDTFSVTNTFWQGTFVTKLDDNGGFIWAKQIGNEEDYVTGQAIDLDASGNIYIVGGFHDTVDFDPGLGVANLYSHVPTDSTLPDPPYIYPYIYPYTDLFILKLNPDGEFVWVRQIRSSLSFNSNLDRIRSISINEQGSLYISGEFLDTLVFNPNMPNATQIVSDSSYSEVFIAKYDVSGEFEWVKKFDGSLYSRADGNCVVSDANDNVYVTGRFNYQVDFDSGPDSTFIPSNGNFDIFLAKLNAAGNLSWVSTFGAENNDAGNDLSIDINGDILFAGYFELTVDFDPSIDSLLLTTASFNPDGFVAKVDSSGQLIWVRQLAGQNDVYSQSISTDGFSNSFVTGEYRDNLEFGVNLTPLESENGTDDIFITKLDALGNVIWRGSIGGTSAESNASIVANLAGDVHVTGTFLSSPCDFNPTIDTFYLTTTSIYDGFILKLGNCVTSPSFIDVVGCDEYHSPSGYYTWTTSGTYEDYLTNSVGCDSTVNINLTIVDIDNSILYDIGSQSLITLDQDSSYQWLDCENNNSPIIGEVEHTFELVNSGSYAVAINTLGCSDTSECIMVSGIGINDVFREKQISIYPNPTNGTFIIEQNLGNGLYSIVVRNSLGQLLSRKEFENSRALTVEITGSAGLYFVELSNDSGQRQYFKVIKK